MICRAFSFEQTIFWQNFKFCSKFWFIFEFSREGIGMSYNNTVVVLATCMATTQLLARLLALLRTMPILMHRAHHRHNAIHLLFLCHRRRAPSPAKLTVAVASLLFVHTSSPCSCAHIKLACSTPHRLCHASVVFFPEAGRNTAATPSPWPALLRASP